MSVGAPVFRSNCPGILRSDTCLHILKPTCMPKVSCTSQFSYSKPVRRSIGTKSNLLLLASYNRGKHQIAFGQTSHFCSCRISMATCCVLQAGEQLLGGKKEAELLSQLSKLQVKILCQSFTAIKLQQSSVNLLAFPWVCPWGCKPFLIEQTPLKLSLKCPTKSRHMAKNSLCW